MKIKFLRKLQYKNEFKSIKLIISYLLKEAELGNSTQADIPFWKLYIERLEELSDNNIKGSKELLEFTNEMYDKYISNIEIKSKEE